MSNVPEHLRHLETISIADIEREILALRPPLVDPRNLTDEQLERAVALHAIATRKTAGPAKPKAAKGPDLSDASMEDIAKHLGL